MAQLNSKVVGGLIRDARTQTGLTQAELAEAAEVSDETVRRIELGAYEPSLSTMVALAKALHVSVEYLTEPADGSKQISGFPPLVHRLATEAARFPTSTQRALLSLLQELTDVRATPLAPVQPPRRRVAKRTR